MYYLVLLLSFCSYVIQGLCIYTLIIDITEVLHVCTCMQSIILEHEIEEQEKAISVAEQQLQSAKAKLEHTNSSLTDQIETLEVSVLCIQQTCIYIL